MDIIIKSFNRPYYLDRCIQSIYKFVKGNFTITIVDDGTPPEYLEKIKLLYPKVVIKTSASYQQKVNAIKSHVQQQQPFELSNIPVDLWVNQVKESTDIFILFEDDFWFTGPVDVTDIEQEMVKHQIVLTRLSWQGNPRLINGRHIVVNNNIEIVVPTIPLLSAQYFLNQKRTKRLIRLLYKTKISSPLYRLGILKDEFDLRWPVYAIYSVAAAVYNKKYWLSVWDGAGNKVDEAYQLKKALEWKAMNKSKYAKTTYEVAQTSYITSATTTFDNVSLDLFKMNYLLNEAWLKGYLDSMQGFPKDFSMEYLGRYLSEANDAACTVGAWMSWVDKFKGQYKAIGCQVD